MELLLILSALLSALTGALGTRAPELRSHQIAVVRDVAPAARAIVHSVRPPAAASTLATLARRPQARILTLASTSPLYATRRRE